jgi:hypothetical protein
MGAERDQQIAEMESMGFERADIEAAMRAAFYNSERAIEYLLTVRQFIHPVAAFTDRFRESPTISAPMREPQPQPPKHPPRRRIKGPKLVGIMRKWIFSNKQPKPPKVDEVALHARELELELELRLQRIFLQALEQEVDWVTSIFFEITPNSNNYVKSSNKIPKCSSRFYNRLELATHSWLL